MWTKQCLYLEVFLSYWGDQIIVVLLYMMSQSDNNALTKNNNINNNNCTVNQLDYHVRYLEPSYQPSFRCPNEIFIWFVMKFCPFRCETILMKSLQEDDDDDGRDSHCWLINRCWLPKYEKEGIWLLSFLDSFR